MKRVATERTGTRAKKDLCNQTDRAAGEAIIDAITKQCIIIHSMCWLFSWRFLFRLIRPLKQREINWLRRAVLVKWIDTQLNGSSRLRHDTSGGDVKRC